MARHGKDDRPHPLLNEATWRGAFGAVAIGGAFIGAEQITALPEAIDPVLKSLAAGGVLFTARNAAKAGEKYVTPTTDPKDDYGNPLVAISPEI